MLWVDSKLQKINIKPIQAVLLFVVVLRDKFAGLCQPCLGDFLFVVVRGAQFARCRNNAKPVEAVFLSNVAIAGHMNAISEDHEQSCKLQEGH